ncbi:MAG: heavy metal translocating P-type ATPase [Lachnospiraceae bacterium]|nr:heavy metal translocating P-type ATPase [Lachnospiraceae bacterium]
MSGKLKKEGKRILCAIVILAVLMITEKTGAVPAVFENRILTLVLYLIPYLIAGADVLKNAVLGIMHGQMMDESFLMTIATIGAFITGEYEEAAAVMLFYQVGEWFQSYAVGKSRGSITELMNIAPESANLEHEDGSIEEIDPDDVEIGNILVIRPGEKIPVDGEVLTGESLVNTAALTGESVPRTARPGSQVISGCVNGEGLLRIRALKAYEDSTVSRILEMVEEASEKKSKTEAFITRFARYYTPAVVFGALALAIIPSIVTGEWMTWIYRACTFLVISCPCALVISVPLAFFGGIGAASKNGALVKGSNYLELLASLETVVSDKTGTLTEGSFRVTEVIPAAGVSEEEVLRAAAAAEGLSTHPIAKSICEAFAKTQEGKAEELSEERITDTDNYAGEGLTAVVGGKTIAVGNGRLMERFGAAYTPVEDAASTICYVAEDGRYLGAVLISDTIKKDTKAVIAAMKEQGVKNFVMLTGDHRGVAEAVGREIGVDKVYAELLPQDKVARVEELLKGGEGSGATAFIGDGINDAPVLMRADVGIAMGMMGSDAAIEAADLVIMDDDLSRIPKVMKIARKTVGISKQNIVFALAVKALILVLGAFGIANMWAAVFADVGVAVLCILNAMRLLAVKSTI